MRKKTRRAMLSLVLTAAVAATAVTGGYVGESDRAMAAEETEENVLKIDSQNLYDSNSGIFEGWGTSLCWFGNRIGASEQTSAEAAQLLCNSKDGLGLNIIRFNIGGGDDPTHTHITRTDSKMPGYWGEYDAETDTFTYDYTKDERQRNVLVKMLAENKDLTVEAFSNSPPYFMTESGCTSGTAKNEFADNLKADKYDDFAEYMADVVKYYRESYGINISSVEPMNENGWSISRNGVKQEGCSFIQGESQSKLFLAMDRAMKNNGLQDLTLAGFDQSAPNETITCLDSLSQDALDVLERLDTHTYSTTSSEKLRDRAKEMNLSLWMSESDGGDIAGKNAGEMGAGLALAKRIGRDMYRLQPSAWIIWQAIGSYCGSEPFDGNSDPATLNQSDLDKKGFWGVTYADMDQEKVVLTKKYYAMGQYTRYIKKGDYMIVGDSMNTVSYDKENNELKVVAVNLTDTAKTMKYDLSGFQWSYPIVKRVRTSGDMSTCENWKTLDSLSSSSAGFEAELAPNSVTTFIVKEPAASGEDLPEAEKPGGDDNINKPQSVSPQKVAQVKVGKTTANKAVVTWKKQSGMKYKVAYSTDKKKLGKIKDGSGKAAAGTKVVSAAGNKVTLKKLKKNRVYYLKVCAYQRVNGKTVYGKYSAVKRAKTKKK